MTEPEHDPLPAFLAEIDQTLMMVPHLARWAYSLFEAFLAEGFNEEQALRLTMNQVKVS